MMTAMSASPSGWRRSWNRWRLTKRRAMKSAKMIIPMVASTSSRTGLPSMNDVSTRKTIVATSNSKSPYRNQTERLLSPSYSSRKRVSDLDLLRHRAAVPVAMRMGNIWSPHGQVEQTCNRCCVARTTATVGRNSIAHSVRPFIALGSGLHAETQRGATVGNYRAAMRAKAAEGATLFRPTLAKRWAAVSGAG